MKKILFLLSFLTVTGLLVSCCCKNEKCASAAPAEKLNIDIYKSATPILGGTLLKGFSWKGNIYPTQPTTVQVDRTSDGCFLAEFTCYHKKGAKIVKRGKKEDDMSIFAGEAVELFLCPDPATKVYYQFAVSPTLAAYTARGKDYSWNCPALQKKVQFFPDHYKITLKVPFKALGVKSPKNGEIWKVNFCRTHIGKGFRENSNWAGSGNYHDLDSYGQILFAPKNTASSITLDSFLCESGRIQFKLELSKMKNPLEVWVERRDFRKKAGIIPPGKNAVSFRLKMPDNYMPLKYEERVFITVKDAVSKKTVFARELNVSNNLPDFLVLDKFYCRKGDKVSFRVEPPITKKIKNVTILLKSGNKTVMRKIFAGNSGTVDTAKLKAGRYVLEATDGVSVASRVFFVRKKDFVPKTIPANKAIVKKKGLPGMPGVLTIDGKEIFLVAASTSYNGASYTSKNCFNYAYDAKYSASPFVRMSGTPGKRLIRKPRTGFLYLPEEKFLANLVKHFGKQDLSKPAIHRLTYEAQLPAFFPGKKKGSVVMGDTFAIHKKMYEAVKAKYPKAMLSLQTERFDTIPQFIHSCDIMEVVPKGSYSIASMVNMPCGIKAMADACAPTSTPVVLWVGVTIPNNSCRRVEEVRATLYMSVMHGISGVIFHMGHDAMPKNNLRMWNFLSQILGEVQSFHGEFAAMKPVKDGEIVQVKGKDFVSRTRAAGKKALMLFVSTSPYENKVTFRAEKGYIFACGKKELTMTLTPYESLALRLKKVK